MKSELKINHGIVGDAHAGNWHRQISLLAEESIDTMRGIRHTACERNICGKYKYKSVLTLKNLPVGTWLKVGDNAVIEVTQIGKECHNDCEIKQKVGKCVMPTEGIFAIVIKEGIVRKGDELLKYWRR